MAFITLFSLLHAEKAMTTRNQTTPRQKQRTKSGNLSKLTIPKARRRLI